MIPDEEFDPTAAPAVETEAERRDEADDLAALQSRIEEEKAEERAKAARDDATMKTRARLKALQKAAAKAKTPALNLSRLSSLERHIGTMNSTGYRTELVQSLRETAGLEVQVDEAGTVLTMEGVSIDPAPDMALALSNWAAAARRAIMQAVA